MLASILALVLPSARFCFCCSASLLIHLFTYTGTPQALQQGACKSFGPKPAFESEESDLPSHQQM